MFSLAKHSFQNSRNKLQVPPPWKAYNSIPVVAGGLLLQNGLAGQPAGVWDAGAVAAAVGGGGCCGGFQRLLLQLLLSPFPIYVHCTVQNFTLKVIDFHRSKIGMLL